MTELMTADLPRPFALQYLDHIEALRDEIRVGMDAIGVNALSDFEQSVARQQQICMHLCRMNEQVQRSDPPSALQVTDVSLALKKPGDTRLSNAVLAEKVRVAAESLQSLNKQYAALLKHSGESIRLFAMLCQGYNGSLHQGAAGMSGRRTPWSCEL